VGVQVKALKEGKAVGKPIYNHVTGALDPAENVDSPNVSPHVQCPAQMGPEGASSKAAANAAGTRDSSVCDWGDGCRRASWGAPLPCS
jgi:hypothetical protein